MKKTLLQSIFILSTLIAVYPTTVKAQMGIGMEGGVNLSLFTVNKEFNDQYDTKPQLGFSFGALALFPLSYDGKLWIVPSVRFIQKGGSYFSEEPNVTILYELLNDGDLYQLRGEIDIKETLSYLEIPLQVQVRLTPNSSGFFVQGGPYLGLGLRGKRVESAEFTEVLGNNNQYVPLPEELYTRLTQNSSLEFGTSSSDDYSTDVGIYFGGGYFSQNMDTNRSILLNLRFGLGLKDLFSPGQARNAPVSGLRSGGLKNLTIDLSVAYTFDRSVN